MSDDMTSVVVCERVLTDDILAVDGDRATLTYHTYASPWSDHEHEITFDSHAEARLFIRERYGEEADWDLVDMVLA